MIGCDALPGRPKLEHREVRPDEQEGFAHLYAQNCAGCHGPEGKGNAALALANPVYLAIADDAVLRRVITSGVDGTQMPAFARTAGGTLTDKQVEILVQGIRGWAQPGSLQGAVAAALRGDVRGRRGPRRAGLRRRLRVLSRAGGTRRAQGGLHRGRVVP